MPKNILLLEVFDFGVYRYSICNIGPLLGPENRAYFIKVAYRRNRLKENFVSGKMFTTLHLRKKWSQISGIPDPESGFEIYNFRILNVVYEWSQSGLT